MVVLPHGIPFGRTTLSLYELSHCKYLMTTPDRECLLSFGAENLSCVLPTKNTKSKTRGTKIVPVDLYGCETVSVTVREGQRVMAFENGVLRINLGRRGTRLQGRGEDCITRS
jgi:hypothetical protein